MFSFGKPINETSFGHFWPLLTTFDHFWPLLTTLGHFWPLLATFWSLLVTFGFENITYGFVLKQCVSELVLGVVVGVSAIVGVLGSIAFPFLRKLLNLGRTGLMGMYILVACLTLCLASNFNMNFPEKKYMKFLVSIQLVEVFSPKMRSMPNKLSDLQSGYF